MESRRRCRGYGRRSARTNEQLRAEQDGGVREDRRVTPTTLYGRRSHDDEIMELCILSNELNACETTAILNPSKFASCATRLGLREGFAVDLTTARATE